MVYPSEPMHPHDWQHHQWQHPGYAQLPPPPAPGRASGAPRKRSRAWIVALALLPLGLVATCVGMFVGPGYRATRRAEETLRVCAPSGDADACARVTGTEDDPKAVEGIRRAVAQLEESFGPFVSLSPRGTCSYVGDGGSRRELSAEATFERTTTPMHFRWHDDELVGFAPESLAPRCE